jgi:hypothetical protein
VLPDGTSRRWVRQRVDLSLMLRILSEIQVDDEQLRVRGSCTRRVQVVMGLGTFSPSVVDVAGCGTSREVVATVEEIGGRRSQTLRPESVAQVDGGRESKNHLAWGPRGFYRKKKKKKGWPTAASCDPRPRARKRVCCITVRNAVTHLASNT